VLWAPLSFPGYSLFQDVERVDAAGVEGSGVIAGSSEGAR